MQIIRGDLGKELFEKMQSDGDRFVSIFYIENCYHCDNMIRFVHNMSEEIEKFGFKIIIIDALSVDYWVKKYSLSNVPVWMAFIGDKILERIDGSDMDSMDKISSSVIFSKAVKEQY